MEIELSCNLWPDLIAFSALFTLGAYHVMIYSGRKENRKEVINLYFAWFIFSLALFIMAPYFRKDQVLCQFRPNWIYAINIEMITIWLVIISGIQFLSFALNLSSKFKKNFRFSYFAISMNVLLSLTSNFISTDFYFKNILIVVICIIAINAVLINFLFGLWIYKKRMYNEKFIRILYLGHLLLTFNIIIYRIIEIKNSPFTLIFGHYLTLFLLFVLTYALLLKINKEHGAIEDLKLLLDSRNGGLPKLITTNYKTPVQNHYKPIAYKSQINRESCINERFLQKALQIIEKNINETGFNPQKLSAEIGISRAHLHRKLKALTDQSATEFIRSFRLKKAAELLNQNNSSVSEIAYCTGFNNLSYFTRCFKEEFGVVPSKYIA